MKKQYMAKLTDATGVEWVFEGSVMGLPIWTEKGKHKRVMKFIEEEALSVARAHAIDDDVPGVEYIGFKC
jgi:hypothetical protein